MQTETIETLHSAILRGLIKAGVTNYEQVATVCLGEIVNSMSGCQWYIPKKQVLEVSIEQKIFEDFDGSNVKLLAVKYGFSATKIYQIILEQRSKAKD